MHNRIPSTIYDQDNWKVSTNPGTVNSSCKARLRVPPLNQPENLKNSKSFVSGATAGQYVMRTTMGTTTAGNASTLGHTSLEYKNAIKIQSRYGTDVIRKISNQGSQKSVHSQIKLAKGSLRVNEDIFKSKKQLLQNSKSHQTISQKSVHVKQYDFDINQGGPQSKNPSGKAQGELSMEKIYCQQLDFNYGKKREGARNYVTSASRDRMTQAYKDKKLVNRVETLSFYQNGSSVKSKEEFLVINSQKEDNKSSATGTWSRDRNYTALPRTAQEARVKQNLRQQLQASETQKPGFPPGESKNPAIESHSLSKQSKTNAFMDSRKNSTVSRDVLGLYSAQVSKDSIGDFQKNQSMQANFPELKPDPLTIIESAGVPIRASKISTVRESKIMQEHSLSGQKQIDAPDEMSLYNDEKMIPTMNNSKSTPHNHKLSAIIKDNSVVLKLNLNNSSKVVKSNYESSIKTSTRIQTTLAPSGKYYAHQRFGSIQDRRQQRNNSSMDFQNQNELSQISAPKPAYKQFLRTRGSEGFNSVIVQKQIWEKSSLKDGNKLTQLDSDPVHAYELNLQNRRYQNQKNLHLRALKNFASSEYRDAGLGGSSPEKLNYLRSSLHQNGNVSQRSIIVPEKFQEFKKVLINTRKDEAIEHALYKNIRISKQQEIEDLLDVKQGDKKDRDAQLKCIFNLQKTEYFSKKIRTNEIEQAHALQEHKVQSMLEKRNLKDHLMQVDPETQLIPIVIQLPLTLAQNPEVEDSIDLNFVEGCKALHLKQYVKAYQLFQICGMRYRRFRKFAGQYNNVQDIEATEDQMQQSSKQLTDANLIFSNKGSRDAHYHFGRHEGRYDGKNLKQCRDVHTYSSSQHTIKTDSSFECQDIYSPRAGKHNKTEPSKMDLHQVIQKEKNTPKIKLEKEPPEAREAEINTIRVINEVVDRQDQPESHLSPNLIDAKSTIQTKLSEGSKPQNKEPLRNLSKIEKYYATLSESYMEKLNQMSNFNKAVCLFKNKKFDQSIKIWETFDAMDNYQKNEKNHFPISSLFNLAISHYLKRNYETSIDLTQELITKICNQTQDTPEGLELQAELEFIGPKDLKTNCLKLLKYLEEELGVIKQQPKLKGQSEGELLNASDRNLTKQEVKDKIQQQDQLREFRSILINDMRKWLNDGFKEMERAHQQKTAKVQSASDIAFTQFRLTTTNATIAGDGNDDKSKIHVYQDYRQDKIVKNLKRDPIKLQSAPKDEQFKQFVASESYGLESSTNYTDCVTLPFTNSRTKRETSMTKSLKKNRRTSSDFRKKTNSTMMYNEKTLQKIDKELQSLREIDNVAIDTKAKNTAVKVLGSNKLESSGDMSHLFPHSTHFNHLKQQQDVASLLKQRVRAKFTQHNVKQDQTTIKNRVLQELRNMYKDITEKYDQIKLKESNQKFSQEVGKITNMLTESKLEAQADQKEQKDRDVRLYRSEVRKSISLSMVKKREQTEHEAKQKTEMQRIIERLRHFIWHFEHGQYLGRTAGKSVDIKKSKQPLKTKRGAKKRSVSADFLMQSIHGQVMMLQKKQKDEEAELTRQLRNNVQLKSLVKYWELKAKWAQRKSQILRDTGLNSSEQMSIADILAGDNYGKEQNTNQQNEGEFKTAHIWHRAFRKIRLLKEFKKQEEIKERLEKMEQERLREILDKIVLTEGENMIQRNPTSMMPQVTIMDDLNEMFIRNLINVNKLGWRIKCLNKQALKKEEEFNRYTEDRILKAIEEKKKQQVFQKMPKKDETDFSDYILPTDADNSKSHSAAISQKVQPALRRQNLVRTSDDPMANDIHALMQIKIGERMDRTDPADIKAAQDKKLLIQQLQDNHSSFQRRLREREAKDIAEYMETIKRGQIPVNYDIIDQYITRFPYFSKYSESVRKRLLDLAELRLYKKNEIIFRQGEPSPNIYFVLRGTVAISVKNYDMGNIPVIIKILYDGQDFGEQVMLKETEDLSQEVIDQLNQQKCTTYANEQSYILTFSKEVTFGIIEKGLQSDFEKVIQYLKQLEIFRDQEMHIILPLANNVQKKTYTFGQYILKEGNVPQGLYMIVRGQCRVGSEKLNIRTKSRLPYEKFQKNSLKPMTLKGNFKDEFIREEQRNRERIPIKNETLKEKMSFEQYQTYMQANQRILFNDKIYMDEDGTKIEKHLVYKDMMIFFQLLENDVFGGRVMVTKTHQQKDVEPEDEPSLMLSSDDSSCCNKCNEEKSEVTEYVAHEPSQLSVIADSSEVEILLIDKNNMHLFPEDVQKVLNERLSQIFSAERPYEKDVVEGIRDKFREWDRYKIQAFLHQTKMQYNIRFQNLTRANGAVPR